MTTAASLALDIASAVDAIRAECLAAVRGGYRPHDTIARFRAIDVELDRISAATTVMDGRDARDSHGDGPPGAVDVLALARDARRRFHGIAASRGLRLWLWAHHPQCIVSGRAAELRRMLDELLARAIDRAAFGDTVTIAVSERRGFILIGVDGHPPRPPDDPRARQRALMIAGAARSSSLANGAEPLDARVVA